jgi:acid phosphatase family membrane protein YuiD
MSYIYLIVPIVAVSVAQLSKFFIPQNKLAWKLRSLVAYSGMPSSHAAITISLSTIIALRLGFDSAQFAIAALFTLLSLRDAVGIRQYIGRQGKVLNELVGDLGDDSYIDDSYPILKERVGHTPKQLLVGAAIGFIIALLGHYLIV